MTRLSSLLPLAAGLVLAYACSGDGAAEPTPAGAPAAEATAGASARATAPKRYPTAVIELADVARPILVTGRVVPLQQATLSSQVPGLVLPTDKLLQEGKYYGRGETVVTIDAEPLRLTLQAARAEFASALVRLLPALRSDHPRAYPTYKAFVDAIDATRPLPPLPAPATDTLRYFLAANGIDGQYYRIGAQEATLDDYVVAAPFAGRLTSASVEPGAVVQPGQVLATLSRTDAYEVRLAVPADAAALVAPGQKLSLRSRNLGRDYAGTVNRLAPAVDAATQTVTAFARVSGEGLRTGLYLEAELAGEPLEAVAVLPKEALGRDGGVHVINEAGVVALAPVEVASVEAEKVYLRGLAPGTRVITVAVPGEAVGTRPAL